MYHEVDRLWQRLHFLSLEFSIQVVVLWEEPCVVFLQILVLEFRVELLLCLNKCCFFCSVNEGGLDQGKCCQMEQNILLYFSCVRKCMLLYPSHYFFSLQCVCCAPYAQYACNIRIVMVNVAFRVHLHCPNVD